MRSAYSPANQLYTPYAFDKAGKPILTAVDLPAKILGRVGQVSPYVSERQRTMHGRYLSGLGADDPAIGPSGEDPGYNENLLPSLEQDDDAFGSGIFDQPGSRSTANAEMGVFTSEYGIPGYVAREVPYAVSKDISDVIDGGEVVMIPGGGFYHAERDTRRAPSPVLGPTPLPPANVPALPSGIAQPIVTMQPAWAARPNLNANAPLMSRSPWAARRTVASANTTLPISPSLTALPIAPAMQTLPYKSIVQGVGQDASEEPTSAGKLAMWGLVLGAGVGLMVGVLKSKPSLMHRNRRRHGRRHAR